MSTADAHSEFRIPNSALPDSLPVALSVAGSDSGGGAGIQADLKVFTALGCFGTTAITCVTAQNPGAVTGVMAMTPDIISAQIDTVCEGFTVAAAKTGMLFSEEIIRIVAETISAQNIEALVVDPVMVATSGSRLLQEAAVAAMLESVLPLAAVITPNLPEAEVICGRALVSIEDVELASKEIAEQFSAACVIKGGHMTNAEYCEESVDVLAWQGEIAHLSSPRIEGVNTHGSGCSFSAAITAYLARGYGVREAVQNAKTFIGGAIANPSQVGDENYLNLTST